MKLVFERLLLQRDGVFWSCDGALYWLETMHIIWSPSCVNVVRCAARTVCKADTLKANTSFCSVYGDSRIRSFMRSGLAVGSFTRAPL